MPFIERPPSLSRYQSLAAFALHLHHSSNPTLPLIQQQLLALRESCKKPELLAATVQGVDLEARRVWSIFSSCFKEDGESVQELLLEVYVHVFYLCIWTLFRMNCDD